jgi:hypothetical protein
VVLGRTAPRLLALSVESRDEVVFTAPLVLAFLLLLGRSGRVNVEVHWLLPFVVVRVEGCNL